MLSSHHLCHYPQFSKGKEWYHKLTFAIYSQAPFTSIHHPPKKRSLNWYNPLKLQDSWSTYGSQNTWRVSCLLILAYSVPSARNVLSCIWLASMFQNSAEVLPPLLISAQSQTSLLKPTVPACTSPVGQIYWRCSDSFPLFVLPVDSYLQEGKACGFSSSAL